jgi:hypothetical protein
MISIALLVACGMTETRFREDYSARACALEFQCVQEDERLFATQAECVAFYKALFVLMEDCTYQKPSGTLCMESVATMTCEGYLAGSAAPACEVVWTGTCAGNADTGDTGDTDDSGG